MRYYTTILLLLSFFLLTAQENEQRITIAFDGSTTEEVLNQIEEISDFRFYYVRDWLSDTSISGDFRDDAISTVLESIFKETVINFYILSDNQIILTRNNAIYDSFPEGFIAKSEEMADEGPEITEHRKIDPLFYNEEKSSERKKVETFRIGKENKNNRKRQYTLTGLVKNRDTGEPIADLAITVAGTSKGTTTNSDGFYKIDLSAGLNILETSALGIESLRLRVFIYNNGELNLNLNEGFETLDEVVVEGNRAGNVRQELTGVTQIQVEGIKTIPLVLGERDILKAATTLPGISNAGEGAAGFNVRGGRTDQNLILLDNAVIYNPSHFFGIFSALNPFTTGVVDIYKGSMPPEFGGRLSSVFDINTKDGNTQEFSGEASIGPVTSNLMLEVPVVKNKSALVIGGRATYSDWILKSLNETSLDNSRASFYDFVASYKHKINKNNDLKASGYYSNDVFSITSDSLFDYSNRLFSLKWNHKFGEKSAGSFSLSNSEYRFNIEYDGDSDNDFDLGYKINETEFKMKLKYLFNDVHNFDYGISSKLYSVNPGNIGPKGSESIVTTFDIPKEKGLESALFLSDRYTVNDKLLINAGLRYSLYMALGESSQRIYENGSPKNSGTLVEVIDFDKNEIVETYGGPELRVSGRYFLAPDFSAKASYNNTFQYIHTLSSNTTVSPTDTWKLSDKNIKPQKANQIALGLYRNLRENMYELSLEGYYKKSKNILDYKVGAQLLLNEEIETEVIQGDGKAYGVEFLIRKSEGKLNGWLGYTYSRSWIKLDSRFSEERVNGGSYFPSNFDKPHDVNLVANYRFTKRFSASANFVYQTGRPVTFPSGRYVYRDAEYVFYSDRNQFRIPDYYRLDIGFNMEGNHKIKKFTHSFWNFSVYNVLGRNNPYSVFFVTKNGDLQAYKSSIFSIPVPTITYNFKF